jgi:hypothetical protein
MKFFFAKTITGIVWFNMNFVQKVQVQVLFVLRRWLHESVRETVQVFYLKINVVPRYRYRHP